MFREILAQSAAVGVEFDVDMLRVDRIREELEYGGLRLRTTASHRDDVIGTTARESEGSPFTGPGGAIGRVR